jgi:hypothetical protein
MRKGSWLGGHGFCGLLFVLGPWRCRSTGILPHVMVNRGHPAYWLLFRIL